jgi:hypothetical protein
LPFITGAKSSTLSEEGGKSGGTYSGKDYGCDEENDSSELMKFKSQLGIINKMKLTVLVA